MLTLASIASAITAAYSRLSSRQLSHIGADKSGSFVDTFRVEQGSNSGTAQARR